MSGPWLQSDLDSIHRRESRLPGGGGKADRPVEAVVIGYRQRPVAEEKRLLDQILGMGGTVEKREVGVAVQFGILEHLFGRVLRRSTRSIPVIRQYFLPGVAKDGNGVVQPIPLLGVETWEEGGEVLLVEDPQVACLEEKEHLG